MDSPWDTLTNFAPRFHVKLTLDDSEFSENNTEFTKDHSGFHQSDAVFYKFRMVGSVSGLEFLTGDLGFSIWGLGFSVTVKHGGSGV